MLFQSELNFLCDVFQRCRVPTAAITEKTFDHRLSENELLGIPAALRKEAESFSRLQTHTLYRVTDAFHRCYRFLLLPEADEPTILLIGPYLSSPISEQRIWEIGEIIGFSPQRQRQLTEYYLSIPVIPPDNLIFSMLHSFCEKIWQSPAFAIRDISDGTLVEPAPYSVSAREADDDDPINTKNLERRYEFENRIIRAVSLGQIHMESQLRTAFSAQHFEKRAADPLRNAKNYAVIMNTLLRKAAESGGVHPLYLDRVSSDFALKIENLPALGDITDLMCEMFREYCRLVRRHSLKNYPPIIQKAILAIDDDLSAELSPHVLAELLEVSLGYLSAAFKKATGTNLSAYIRQRRMEHASYLLRSTNLQIQTIALHCGMVDVQYFSKTFKKQTGKTPTEYRQLHQK